MPKRSEVRLTKRNLDALKSVDGEDFTVWDAELTGFGVRIKPSGLKSFIIKYRADGRQRKATIGKFGPLTVEQARRLAQVELGKVAGGIDPVAEAKLFLNRLSVSEMCDRYLQDAESGKVRFRGKPKKPSTIAVDKGRIERHIKPLLGGICVDDLTRAEVEGFMHDVTAGVTAIDEKTGPHGRAIVRGGVHVGAKSVMLLSAVYRHAIKFGWAEENPCRDVEKPPSGHRDRFISENEYAALGKAIRNAIDKDVSPQMCKATIAMLLTGCRRGEILNLIWREVDPTGRCLRLRDTKTGPQMRPCGKTALDFLEGLGRGKKYDWVFKSTITDGPIREVRKFVDRICGEAELVGVSPHVFRHSYATVAFELGYSELIIAGLLGHRLSSVTSKYAHHVDHVLADAADRVSETIAERLGLHEVKPARIASRTKHRRLGVNGISAVN